jgi:lipoate-protein ligase A
VGSRWERRIRSGPAGELLASPLEPQVRSVAVCSYSDTALILGSAQPLDTIDRGEADALGAALLRRRSGGGAVLVVPGELLWVEVTLPRSDPLWEEDVGRSALWLGRVWARAIEEAAGGPAPTVHSGAMLRSALSPRVCFAGVAAGEVLAGAGGPKQVGIAQRRTREGALFQCAALLEWDAAATARLLVGSAEDKAAAERELEGCAEAVGADGDDLAGAFLAALEAVD